MTQSLRYSPPRITVTSLPIEVATVYATIVRVEPSLHSSICGHGLCADNLLTRKAYPLGFASCKIHM